MLLQTFLNIAINHEIVHALNTVKDVGHTMVWVLFEIAHLNLASKSSEVFQWNMEYIKEIMVLEDLEGEELEGTLVQNLFKVYGVKGYRV